MSIHGLTSSLGPATLERLLKLFGIAGRTEVASAHFLECLSGVGSPPARPVELLARVPHCCEPLVPSGLDQVTPPGVLGRSWEGSPRKDVTKRDSGGVRHVRDTSARQ
jgi:hypothetical protein